MWTKSKRRSQLASETVQQGGLERRVLPAAIQLFPRLGLTESVNLTFQGTSDRDNHSLVPGPNSSVRAFAKMDRVFNSMAVPLFKC